MIKQEEHTLSIENNSSLPYSWLWEVKNSDNRIINAGTAVTKEYAARLCGATLKSLIDNF